MKKILIAALAASALIPVAASAQSAREVRQDRAEVRRDMQRGDYREAREDRQEAREDWRDYRRTHQSTYRRGTYNAPRGYRYAPVRIGINLNPVFYGNRYSINDPWTYRLPRANAGTRWIRYGNDVLLINTRTGRVLQVHSRFFY